MKFEPTFNESVTGSVIGHILQYGSTDSLQSFSQCNVTASATKDIVVPIGINGLISIGIFKP